MIDRLKLSLGGVWLITGGSALVLPVFLPSFAGAPGLVGNAIGVSSATMFLLSLPSSLAAIPLITVLNPLFGATGIAVDYINLLLLFGIGYAQWFWLVPRLFGRESVLQRLDLKFTGRNPRLFARGPEPVGLWIDESGATPLERALRDESL